MLLLIVSDIFLHILQNKKICKNVNLDFIYAHVYLIYYF